MQRRMLALGAAALFAPRLASGQSIGGGRPVRLIVPYSPGGATDILSRILAPYMSETLGQSVVIENRSGGNSIVGTEYALRSPPDGQTLGMIDLAFVVNPAMYDSLPYDAQRDAAPIGLVASAAQVLLVNPGVPARTLPELIALGKARPGSLTFGSAGAGTAVRIAGEQFRMAAGIEILHVPYRGGGETLVAVTGGQVSMIFSGQAQAKELADAGRARPLAISGGRRGRRMPDVPTFAELGLPSVDVVTINGLIAPAATPRDVIRKLHDALARTMEHPMVNARLNELGFDIVGGSPESFADWIGAQIPKWTALVRAANIRPD